jgi:hypothetical protein
MQGRGRIGQLGSPASLALMALHRHPGANPARPLATQLQTLGVFLYETIRTEGSD